MVLPDVNILLLRLQARIAESRTVSWMACFSGERRSRIHAGRVQVPL